MSIFLVQSASGVSCAAAAMCSGLALHSATNEALAQVGDVATATERTVTMANATQPSEVAFMFDCKIPASYTWDAGDWVIPINFTTGDTNITLEEVHVCRVSSGCVNQESLGSTTGINHVTSTGGVAVVVNQAGTATPAANDRVAIVLGFDNIAKSGTHSFGITLNRTITCPFVSDPSAGATTSLIASQGGWRQVVSWAPTSPVGYFQLGRSVHRSVSREYLFRTRVPIDPAKEITIAAQAGMPTLPLSGVGF